MSFLNFSDLKATFPNVANFFKTESAFAGVQNLTDNFIKESTGVAIPISADVAPDWSKVPACLLAYYFTVRQAATPTAELLTDAKNAYNEAQLILQKHQISASNNKFIAIDVRSKYKW